jgi:hypothetical protein
VADSKARAQAAVEVMKGYEYARQKGLQDGIAIDAAPTPEAKKALKDKSVLEFTMKCDMDGEPLALDDPLTLAYIDGLDSDAGLMGGNSSMDIRDSNLSSLAALKNAFGNADPDAVAKELSDPDTIAGLAELRATNWAKGDGREKLQSGLEHLRKKGLPAETIGDLLAADMPLGMEIPKDIGAIAAELPGLFDRLGIDTKGLAETKAETRAKAEIKEEFEEADVAEAPKLTAVMSLKKDFQLQSKDFIALMNTFDKAVETRDLYMGGGTGAKQAWQTLNVMFQKTIDPTSVVRESEFARTVGFQSFVDRMNTAIEKGLTGRVTEDLINEVFANIEVLKNAAQEGQRVRVGNYEAIAEEYGIRPDFITGGVAAPDTKYHRDPDTGQYYVEE